MGKNKLQRFAENETFPHLIQAQFMEVWRDDHAMKGHWHGDFFCNDNSITLELGCGRGEYTLALAQRYPERNFIGVDIKGARLWYGAKQAHLMGLRNVGFLRTRIETLGSFFADGEVNEIWITFPDPQLKTRREGKRLTAVPFLACYQRILTPTGLVHLKTDSLELHQYTLGVLARCGVVPEVALQDIDPCLEQYPELAIPTKYEMLFRGQGKSITYLSFSLPETCRLALPPGPGDEGQ